MSTADNLQSNVEHFTQRLAQEKDPEEQQRLTRHLEQYKQALAQALNRQK